MKNPRGCGYVVYESFLGTSQKGGASEDPKSVQVLLEELAPLEEETARELACLAYVLGRIASADQSVSPEEEVAIRELLEPVASCPTNRPSWSQKWRFARRAKWEEHKTTW